MPNLAKVISEDEEKLQFAQVDELIPEYINEFGNPEELHKILFRLLHPHAHNARTEWEKRKTDQNSRQNWIQTIVNNQVSLRITQDKIHQMAAEKAKDKSNQSNNGILVAGR